MRQIGALVALMIASLPRRWGASLVVVLSLAAVVGVLVALLAMAQGMEKTMMQNARADRVVILRKGQYVEAARRTTRAEADTLLSIPGLKQDADGKPIASREVLTISYVKRRSNGKEASVGVRGVGPKAFQVRPEIKLTQGRAFQSGLRELIAGRNAASLFSGLDIGSHVTMNGTVWTIVGQFEDDGGSYESELWGDADTVLAALQQSAYHSIWALTESDAALESYGKTVRENPNLEHIAWRETDLRKAAGPGAAETLRVLGPVVAGIMALGALFAAVNTLYAAVKARSIEIATLRAIGFGGLAVVTSVIVEGILLCIAGGLLGGFIAYVLFNGYTAPSDVDAV